jgi:iron complex outermembrane receptor protein
VAGEDSHSTSRARGRWARDTILGFIVAIAVARGAAAADDPALTELSLEELMQVEVTLPSRHPESWMRANAAAYVITQDDIRRSGVTNIPDALRLAPGVQVARATASQWAVGIRGFASRIARSVLVLMDGRSVYNPLFAGTYWEVQDTVLDDIEHIEVVRGPGGALWGANAFNGVINIVTKSARQTQGLLAVAGGGTEERGFFSLRYGGQLGPDLYYRAYGKFFDRTAFPNPGGEEFDAWSMGRGGFRVDWAATPDDRATLQGDLYQGDTGEAVGISQYEPPFFVNEIKAANVSGGNLLGRWTHAFSPTSDLVVQTWYDYTFRRDPNFTEQRNSFDIDAQHRFALPFNQILTYGFDYRVTADSTGAVPTIQFVPPDTTLNLVSAFVQDDAWLLDDTVRLTAGTKIEYNTYSDFNYQPSGAAVWTPSARHSLWASISRAVRVPSRLEHDLLLTAVPVNLNRSNPNECLPAGSRCIYPRLTRNTDFQPETILAYQLGYRAQLVDFAFLDFATFYNEYDDLLSLNARDPFPEDEPPLPHVIVPLVFENGLHGDGYGAEVALTLVPVPWWRVTASYSYLRLQLEADGNVPNGAAQAQAQDNASPQNQVNVLSAIDAPWGIRLDSVWRYVDSITVNGANVPSYVTFDVRAARHITDQLELSLVGQNLWQPEHREFSPGDEVPRGFYGALRFQW